MSFYIVRGFKLKTVPHHLPSSHSQKKQNIVLLQKCELEPDT